MYKVFANDVCIYNDAFALPETRAVSPKLVMEDSAAGSLTITLPKENIGYDLVERLTTDISVERVGEVIWTGRIINDQKDFWNNRVLTCEGELAFFNDSTQPPHEYANLTVRQYMEALLAVHNSRVGANRRFTIGAITVQDQDMPTYYTNNEKTIELLNALKERLGGHLRVRHENGVRYLDYLEDCPKAATQTIQFGRNLIEFTRNWDSTEYATAIVPLGARLDESPIKELDAYLTVESVNSGSMYIQNASAVAAYGWIEKVVRWDDVTDPAQLLEKGRKYLSDLQFDNMQIELSALDMRYLDPSAQPVELLDEIQVISRPHGLNRLFPVTRLEIPLDQPEKSTFKLGDKVQTPLTKVNNEVSAKIMQTIENLPKAHNILKTAKDNAMAIMTQATTGYVNIVQDKWGSEALVISNTRDWTQSSKYWLWNMNGLAYFKNYGQEIGVAITMDGSIVADFITAGTMSAYRVRTGILQDYSGNVVFDLDTGKLTMKKGSIDIGNGTFKVDEDGNMTMKKGSITIGVTTDDNGRTVTAFTVDNQGNLTARKGTFYGTIYAKAGTFGGQLQAATGDFQGSLTIGNGKFSVSKDGDMNVSNGAFKVDKNGNVTITKGSINIGSGAFVVDSQGNLTAKKGTFKGAININDNFIVDTTGNLTANNGIFKGTVQAAKFLNSSNGKVPLYEMFNSSNTKITSGYLDLYGITIRNQYTNQISFQVDTYGQVTVNGNITMGAGSSINWGSVSSINEQYAPGYTVAQNAQTTANTAINNAAAASTAAAAAAVAAEQAYQNGCTDEKMFQILTNNWNKCGIFSYESTWGGTRLCINADYIRSGTIAADYVSLACGSGGFSKGYGSDGRQRTYGAMMYGSAGIGNEPYFLVTNLGCRMSAVGAYLYVVSDGVHASSEVQTGSDRRLKNSISYTMDQYDKFFMALKPARFKYNREPDGGMHTGFIAQDVEEALLAAGLSRSDLEALTITHVDDPSQSLSDERYSLRYGEFVALNTHMIQKLYRMLEALLRKESV